MIATRYRRAALIAALVIPLVGLSAPYPQSTAPVAERMAPGDIVTRGQLAAVAPPPGMGVVVSALSLDGERELVVSTSPDGTVSVDSEEATAQPASVKAAATSACSDDTYTHAGYRMRSRYDWLYNPKGAPRSVSGTAKSAIVAATDTAFSGRNSCGQPADLAISHRYLGTSTRSAQVNAAGKCTGNDGHSVTAWRSLDRALAVACTYFTYSRGTKVVLASDVAINAKASWFTSLPSGCRSTIDLRSVMTHERGHSLGLGHVSPKDNPGQVMTTTIRSCTLKRTLGLGDYRGLVQLYGHR